jgi:predicted metal-dependent HD superfamily phosphohydrolase
MKVNLKTMPESNLLLLQDVQVYATNLLLTHLSKSVKFHTLQHTQYVAAACDIIAADHQLAEDDLLALNIAAWFHDTGYVSGQAKGHEDVSVKLAIEFLTEHAVSEDFKNKVIGCIHATRIPQTPLNAIEKIICDADLFHLGADEFYETNRLLREELIEFDGKKLSKKDWRKINIQFMEGHQYFTTYGQQKLQPIKEIHIKEVKEKDEQVINPVKKETDKKKQKELESLFDSEFLTAEEKRKKEKEVQSERGIATIFRIMAQNHSALSQMADSKANILISVNAIILSIIITSLFEKLQTDTNLQIPVAVIVIVCVASIVFSILATRPNISGGTFTREDISAKRTNLLFFGNFHNMSLDDYSWGMNEMLNDKYYMNNSMIKDNYFLGVVLSKKYKNLRIAYNIFMYGIIIAMIAFVIAFLLPSATVVYTAG